MILKSLDSEAYPRNVKTGASARKRLATTTTSGRSGLPRHLDRVLELGPQRRGQRARCTCQCQAVERLLDNSGCCGTHPQKAHAAKSATARPQVFQSYDTCIRNIQLLPANQNAIRAWPCPIAPWASRVLLDGPSTSFVYAPDGIIDKDSTPLLDPSSSARSMRQNHQKQSVSRPLPPESRSIAHTPHRLPCLSPGATIQRHSTLPYDFQMELALSWIASISSVSRSWVS